MELFWLIGAILLLVVFCFDRKVLSFDKVTYKHFTTWFLIGSAIAIVSRYLLGVFPPSPTLSFGTLLMVWWEDVLFSLLPIYYARKFFNPKISTLLTIVASVTFGLGHLYQGPLWAIVTMFYPFYISYRLGQKHGYGTIMALHVTYDIIVVSTFTILAQLEN